MGAWPVLSGATSNEIAAATVVRSSLPASSIVYTPYSVPVRVPLSLRRTFPSVRIVSFATRNSLPGPMPPPPAGTHDAPPSVDIPSVELATPTTLPANAPPKA